MSAPVLGLDLDGVLDHATDFFQTLTHMWPSKVVVITYREDTERAEHDLRDLGIRYDELVLVDSFDAKADVVREHGVEIYFDDQPEMLRNMPEDVRVFLVRNGGNFDFEDRRWMLSNRTGKIL